MRLPVPRTPPPSARRLSVAVLALVLLSSLAGAAPASGPNPFAGTYSWGYTTMTVTNGGRVSGSGYAVYPSGPLGGYTREWYDLRGRVSAAGVMSLSLTVKSTNWAGVTTRYTSDLSGQATLDADGNLVLVTGSGTAFLWYRQ